MKLKYLIVAVMCALFTVGAHAQKFEGLALTPPMGWNSWNKFRMNINETLIREIADAMVSTGLRDAGYIYLNLDDGWQSTERDPNGFVQPDPKGFPSGMRAVGDYIHSKGLDFGIYSDAGRKTCGGRAGSSGHEYQDALTYAQFGVDYLKYDWCATDNLNPKGAYILMRDALYAAGRPIVFSMCEWGKSQPWTWAQEVSHLWRTSGDIGPYFDSVAYRNKKGWHPLSVLDIIDINAPLRKYAGPGHWNDPDMLEVGNGLPVNEDRAHFTMWCMMAAPLILGNDIRTMSRETLDILTNREAIAIDQDSLGVQGLRLMSQDGLEVWFKPLVHNDWAVCFFNRTEKPIDYTVDWNLPGFSFTDDVSGRSTLLNSAAYKIRDLWKKQDAGTTERPMKIKVPARDVILYRLTLKNPN